MASTRSQTVSRYDRLKRSTSVVEPATETGKHLRDCASYTLTMYPVTDESNNIIPLTASRKAEIEETLKSFMPSPESILTKSFFNAPLFPVQLLRDTAELYELHSVPEGLITSLHLASRETTNRSILTHIWFMHLLDASLETMKLGVEYYRHSRSASRLTSATDSFSHPNVLEPDVDRNDGDAQPSVRVLDAAPQKGPHMARVTEPVRVKHPEPGTTEQMSGHKERRNDGAQDGGGGYVDDSRKANYVFQHFKDNRFKGDLRQSIELTLRDYNVCARQHRLCAIQKADYFVNILDGPARTFFFNNASDDMSFDDMATMMLTEYNSNARQLQVYSKLKTLLLDRVMSENEITTVSEGLTKVVTVVKELTPQCPPHFRSEAHKIGYLRNAVLGISWAKLPISNIITSKYSFNGFITALRESLQLEEEIKEVNNNSDTRLVNEDTLYQRYGRDPKFVRKFPPRGDSRHYSTRSTERRGFSGSSRTFEESRRRSECHKCRAPWKPGHRCAPGAIRNHIRQRMRNGESAIHIVSDLVLKMEEENTDDTDAAGAAEAGAETDQNTEEVRIF